MNITFACRGCERATRVEVPASASHFQCPDCERTYALRRTDSGSSGLGPCAVCGCEELFLRSNFPQRLGVAIVVAGFVASSVTWFYHMWFATLGILFATALIDVVLFLLVGSMLQCYRCHAEYRGLEDVETYEPFSLETHERYRQQAARWAEQEQPQT